MVNVHVVTVAESPILIKWKQKKPVKLITVINVTAFFIPHYNAGGEVL